MWSELSCFPGAMLQVTIHCRLKEKKDAQHILEKDSSIIVLITSTSSGVKKWGFEDDINIHCIISVPGIPKAV